MSRHLNLCSGHDFCKNFNLVLPLLSLDYHGVFSIVAGKVGIKEKKPYK